MVSLELPPPPPRNPPTRGSSNHPPNDEASTSAHIYKFNGIDLTTRTMTYDTPAKLDKEKVTNGSLPDPSLTSVSPPSISPPYGSLQIEKPTFDSILRPLKSTIRKTIFVDVKVVDAPLNYNLLLGRSWFYAMTIITSLVFRCVQFPHQGKIVMINQLDYCTPDAHTPTTNNIPFLGYHKIMYESVGVGILKDSSIMGTFPTPLPPTTQHISTINMISTMAYHPLESFDPWLVPSL
jgi:hypothetical protein